MAIASIWILSLSKSWLAMKFPRCVKLFVLVFLAFPITASAAVLTFDETPQVLAWGGGALDQGFSIPTLTTTSAAATYSFNAYSGTYSMVNYNSREGLIQRSSAFDLVGAYFTLYNQPLTFDAIGYDQNGAVLYSQSHTITPGWEFVTLNMSGIWAFGFNPTTPDSHNMQMDNLTYNEVPVPAPATLSFLVLALALTGLRARKQRS